MSRVRVFESKHLSNMQPLLQVQNHPSQSLALFHFRENLQALVSHRACGISYQSRSVTDLSQLIHLFRAKMRFHNASGSKVQYLQSILPCTYSDPNYVRLLEDEGLRVSLRYWFGAPLLQRESESARGGRKRRHEKGVSSTRGFPSHDCWRLRTG